MKIKITNYPYQEFQIGDICDFGEEKNKSLVTMQRAVFLKHEPPFLVKKLNFEPEATIISEPEPATSSQTQTHTQPQPKPESKKLIKNELRKKIQQRKAELDASEKSEKKSFWDRLK